ncbi:MAG: hypothetical protein WBG37_20775 [Desulfobacterales bacterium]
MLELKPLRPEAVESALNMAKRYRLLGEPEDAQSICLDILLSEPDHQEALITLILALADKFSVTGLQPAFKEAMEVVEKLDSSYCKTYYSGIIFERRAKHHLRQGGPGSGAVAYDWFAKALKAFDTALSGCDPDNQDAVLRWNSCARFIQNHPDVKTDDRDGSEMLLDSFDTPH